MDGKCLFGHSDRQPLSNPCMALYLRTMGSAFSTLHPLINPAIGTHTKASTNLLDGDDITVQHLAAFQGSGTGAWAFRSVKRAAGPEPDLQNLRGCP